MDFLISSQSERSASFNFEVRVVHSGDVLDDSNISNGKCLEKHCSVLLRGADGSRLLTRSDARYLVLTATEFNRKVGFINHKENRFLNRRRFNRR